jgi:glycosyltransferase involved in cell wall biosynthesis
MKKLILVHRDLSNLNTGGSYYLANTISHFKKQDLDMEVIDFGKLPRNIRKHRFSLVFYFFKHYLKYTKAIFNFTNHNLYFYLLIPYFINRIRGNKYGCGCHLSQYNLRKNFFMKWFEFLCEYLFLQGASLIVIPSKAAIEQFKVFHLGRKKCFIINPAPNIVNQGNPIFRKHANTLLFVGNIEWRKGLDILLKAMDRLKDLNLHLEIAGSLDTTSDYWKQLKAAIDKYHLNRNVSFHGHLAPDELTRLYRKADLFIFPSRHETYGMVLVEAMSFGLPIVASSIPTTVETIEDSVNGILYQPEDCDALAGAIRRLASDSDLRYRVMQNNYKMYKITRTWEKVGQANLNAISEFLKD